MNIFDPRRVDKVGRRPEPTPASATAGPATGRIPVGIWTEWPVGARWTNEGMTRLLGFMIEGVALGQKYVFRIVLPDGVREEAAKDLAALTAYQGVDYTLHSPGDRSVPADDFEALARFANDSVPVEGWIVLFPYFRHALLLNAPLATIFPDGIPVAFPVPDQGAWGPHGYHLRWREQVQALLDGSDRVVTFSHHVARLQAGDLFGVDPAKIRVVPHAPPNLAHLASYAEPTGRTAASRSHAAGILRRHAKERGWRDMVDYPFEEIDYLAVSTQDRVTKNIRLVAEAVRHLVRRRRIALKLFMTAPIHFGASWTPLPSLLESEQLFADVVSMTDLPRDVHAAFYHCAAMAVHPSIFEGGLGPFPFYEAVSVGTPCLMAKGPHTDELLQLEPSLAAFMFDPNDTDGLIARIDALLSDRASAVAAQAGVLERLKSYGWQDVAHAYAQAAVGTSSVGPDLAKAR